MNQYLSDDDYLFGIFKNYDNTVQTKTLFSRYEEYYLYLGLNRSITNPLNLFNYAKIYIRADTKKTDIRRNYQKIMEFYANATSLLIGIFRVLIFVFRIINNFYAENSITRRIFFLKEFENKNNFDIFKKRKQIKEIISLSDSISIDYSISEINSFDSNLKDFSFGKNGYNNNFDQKTYDNKSEKYIEMKNNFKNNSFSFSRDINDSALKNIQNNQMKIKLNSPFKSEKETIKGNSERTLIKNLNLEKNEDKILEDKQNPKIEYYFNVLEIIISSFCKCCMSKNLKMKYNINNISNSILYNKLDIASYIRNMILIDIFNEIILDEGKKDIINFLSRPILSIQKGKEYAFRDFNVNYLENDFNFFYRGVNDLIHKSNKTGREKKLISIINKNLKELE